LRFFKLARPKNSETNRDHAIIILQQHRGYDFDMSRYGNVVAGWAVRRPLLVVECKETNNTGSIIS
jgi:hypothetical protein